MKMKCFVIILFLLVMLIIILKGIVDMPKENRAIVWTENDQNGNKQIVVYSTKSKRVIRTFPGTLIIGDTQDALTGYKESDGVITVFSITDQWQVVPLGAVKLPRYKRIVAWMEDSLYYIDDTSFMRAYSNNETTRIIDLIGEDRYLTNPTPSYDGKWAYTYRDDTGYHISVFTSDGLVMDTFEGMDHAWYNTQQLLFHPALDSKHLSVFDIATDQVVPMHTASGRECAIDCSLFYTGGIHLDAQGDYLTYLHQIPQRFLIFELDAPEAMAISTLNLQSGKTKTYELPTNQANILCHLVNVPIVKHDENTP